MEWILGFALVGGALIAGALLQSYSPNSWGKARIAELEDELNERTPYDRLPPFVSQYSAPWVADGDHSPWQGTLIPWYSDEQPPWVGWHLCDGQPSAFPGVEVPDLRGWLDVPNWVMCVNGRTVIRPRPYDPNYTGTQTAPEVFTRNSE